MSDEKFVEYLAEITMRSGGKTEENYNMALTIAACCDTEENEKTICDLMKSDSISLKNLYEKALALPHEYMDES